jgi:hypothetical protein
VRDTIIEAFDVQDIDTFYQLLAQVWDALVTNVEIVAIWGAELIKAMKGGAGSVETLRLALWVVHAAFASISAVVVGFHDLWVGFKYAVNLGVDAIQYAISYMMVKINEAIADTWRLIDGIPWVNVTGKVEDATRAADEWRGMMDKSFDTKAPNLWADNWVGAVTKSGEAVMNFGNRAKVDLEKVKAALDDGKIGFDNLTQSTDEGIKQIDVYGNKSEATFRNIKITTEDVKRNIDNATGSIDKMAEAVAEVEYEMEQVYEESGNVVTAVTKITTESSKTKDIVDLMEDGFRTTKDDVLVIGGGLEKVSDQVGITSDGTLVFAKNTGEASDKMTEIANMSGVTREELENMSKTEVKLYTERFKSDLELVKLSAQQTHDLVKTKMEWEAKLEIARLEADSKKAVAAFETIAESVSAAAAATADMFGGLAGATSSVHFYELKDLVEQQLAIEKALADAQIALVAEQTEYMKNQNEKLKRGEATQIIQVTVEGNTEAWLKGLMESLFSEIIVKASAEAFSCLGPTT